MSELSTKALELFASGYNCAQSTFAALAPLVGVDETVAKAVAGGFGGGLRSGEVCGAVSGAVMALSAANPFTDGADAEAKARVGAAAKEFVARFRAECGAVTCRELKPEGCDWKTICPELVERAVLIAEKMLAENAGGGRA